MTIRAQCQDGDQLEVYEATYLPKIYLPHSDLGLGQSMGVKLKRPPALRFDGIPRVNS